MCHRHLAQGTKQTFDDPLEIDVPSANSGMDTTYVYKRGALRGPLVGVVPILLRYLVSFFIVLVTQLQLYHILWLDCLQSMYELHLQMS